MSLGAELDRAAMFARREGLHAAAEWIEKHAPTPPDLARPFGPCEWCVAEGRRRKATHLDQLVPTCDNHAYAGVAAISHAFDDTQLDSEGQEA